MRRLAPRIAVLTAASVTLLGLARGCREPTQVKVDIYTDLSCEELKGTRIHIGKEDDADDLPQVANAVTCTPGPNGIQSLGSLVAVPGGERDDSFALTVVTGSRADERECQPPLYKGCIVSRRRVRFRAHEPLFLPVGMLRVCTDEPCTRDSTCFNKGCVSNQATCAEPGTCDIDPSQDAGSTVPPPQPVDAGTRDAGDSPVDAGVVPIIDSGVDSGLSPCVAGVVCKASELKDAFQNAFDPSVWQSEQCAIRASGGNVFFGLVAPQAGDDVTCTLRTLAAINFQAPLKMRIRQFPLRALGVQLVTYFDPAALADPSSEEDAERAYIVWENGTLYTSGPGPDGGTVEGSSALLAEDEVEWELWSPSLAGAHKTLELKTSNGSHPPQTRVTLSWNRDFRATRFSIGGGVFSHFKGIPFSDAGSAGFSCLNVDGCK